MNESLSLLIKNLAEVYKSTGFADVTFGHIVMILIGISCITLSIVKKWGPLLLISIGFGILLGNIPFFSGLQTGVYEEGSVLNILYSGIKNGLYPSLFFMGIGAMIDFSSLISNPKLLLVGAFTQISIFGTFILALHLGFMPNEAASIGIIGGANGATAIFLSSELAPEIIGIIAVSTFLYMALTPLIQPPLMKLLTTRKERVIRMKPIRAVSQTEKILLPVIGFLIICFLVRPSLPLLGMFFLGNLLRESGVTRRLAETVRGSMLDIVSILIGVTVGASVQATTFLTAKSMKILALGALSFVVATVVGILFVKFMNLFLKKGNKINPLIGNAGVSAILDPARVSHATGKRYDSSNHLMMHAMGVNIAGVVGSAVAAGILLAFLK